MQQPNENIWSELAQRAALLGRAARVSRLDDLGLLLWPTLWGAWLGAGGEVAWAALSALMLAAWLLRSAGWLFINHLPNEDAVPLLRDERLIAAAVIALSGVSFALPTGPGGLLLFGSVVSVLAHVALRRRTLVADAALALAPAWLAPAAFVVQGGDFGPAAGLLFTGAALWSAALVMDAGERVRAAGSLALLIGPHVRWAVPALMLMGVLALFPLKARADLGAFFSLGMLAAAVLAGHYGYLRLRHPDAGVNKGFSYANWWGFAVFCGIAFHFLCKSGT